MLNGIQGNPCFLKKCETGKICHKIRKIRTNVCVTLKRAFYIKSTY